MGWVSFFFWGGLVRMAVPAVFGAAFVGGALFFVCLGGLTLHQLPRTGVFGGGWGVF